MSFSESILHSKRAGELALELKLACANRRQSKAVRMSALRERGGMFFFLTKASRLGTGSAAA